MPLKNPSGTDMTSAQGQETTRKMSARYTHVCASPVMRDGMSASKTAATHTIGVYAFENRVIKRSDFAFFSCAFSTSSMMRAAADSPAIFVVSISITLSVLIAPAITSLPTNTRRGTASPVRADVSRNDFPCTTVPSIGMRSPGLTSMVSPTFTSSGDTSIILSPRFTNALSGLISMSD